MKKYTPDTSMKNVYWQESNPSFENLNNYEKVLTALQIPNLNIKKICYTIFYAAIEKYTINMSIKREYWLLSKCKRVKIHSNFVVTFI